MLDISVPQMNTRPKSEVRSSVFLVFWEDVTQDFLVVAVKPLFVIYSVLTNPLIRSLKSLYLHLKPGHHSVFHFSSFCFISCMKASVTSCTFLQIIHAISSSTAVSNS